MIELDQLWSEMLEKAAKNAADNGRESVADYLRLRSANDVVRTAAVNWLLDTIVELAAQRQQSVSNLAIERNDLVRFEHERAQIVGKSVRVAYGLRCLTAEAGWTRTPADGFMRSGALAIARLRHYGLPRENTVLLLSAEPPLPYWRISEKSGMADSDYLTRHLSFLLEETRSVN